MDRRRVVRWILAGLAAGVLIVGAFVTAVAVSLSGGWDDVFDRTHPQEDDAEVVAARAAGVQRADAELAQVLDLATATLTGALVVNDAARPPVSICSEGQHNWKRDDPYDLECSEIRFASVTAEAASLRADLANLDAALTATGWLPASGGDPVATVPAGGAYVSTDGRSRLTISPSTHGADLDRDEYALDLELHHESFTA